MAYKDFDGLSLGNDSGQSHTVLNGNDTTVDVPDVSFIRDANFTRDGMDLVLDGPNGHLTIKDYYADENSPNLVAPDGSTLTPELVNSFAHSPAQYAGLDTASDESPVGAVQEVTGHATVTHPDGSTETIANGTPIFQGDIIETDAKGAVNIKFVDDTNFAVSEDARLSIDNYVYDPSTQSGENNFSVLKGVFVFTSGLIGRDDPDDVHINTPVGSIGIRGTIIAGNVNTGEITVVEGAIVLTDHNGHEMTLATQFETARFHGTEGIENMGQLDASEIAQKFFVVSQVSPTLFSSINDAATEQNQDDGASQSEQPGEDQAPEGQDAAPSDDKGGDDHSSNATDGSTTGAEQQAAADVPVQTPVPPPVTSQTTTSFGTDTSGLGSSNTTTQSNNTPANNSTVTTTTHSPSTTTTTASPPPPPPPTTHEPTAPPPTPTPTPTVVDHAPTHTPEAQHVAAFFEGVEGGSSWSYNFNKEFSDDKAIVRYELSQATKNYLNSWINDGTGANSSPDILKSVVLDGTQGWTFDETTGKLTLNFYTAWETVDGESMTPFDIQVQAIDASGNGSGYSNYSFEAHNPDMKLATWSNTQVNDGHTGLIYSVTAGTISASATIGADDSKFFFKSKTQLLTLDGANENEIHLGGAATENNMIVVENTSNYNTIIGSDQATGSDTFELKTGHVKAYGMDGSDKFILDLDNGSTLLTDVSSGDMVIDGGHSNFEAGTQLNNLGLKVPVSTGAGQGDSLILQGDGTIDFSAILGAGNKITSIERLVGGVGDQTIKLSYNDVLQMTDGKNTLIINLDGNDRLDLSGMTNLQKVLNDQPIASEGEKYDIFTDGTITIAIHAETANVVVTGAGTGGIGFDGTPAS